MREKINDIAGERRHEPRRTEDVAEGKSKPRHFLGVALSRHPVMAAFIVAIIIALIPVLMLVNQQGKLRAQQDQITNLYTQLQVSRRATTMRFCSKINDNAVASNRTTDVITSFVIDSTRASRTFERVYRELGLPPYRVRLQQSKALARDLVKQKLPVIDCAGIAKQIDRQLAQAGHANLGAKERRLKHYPH